ncbi:MAG: hypothetical protein LBD48_06570, partial [Treponema sp.]|nr:hypothetical protein [Treponema sp.]
LLQNFSFATATAEKRSFTARRAKNCKSLCKTNRVLQQALEAFPKLTEFWERLNELLAPRRIELLF